VSIRDATAGVDQVLDRVQGMMPIRDRV